MGAGDGWVATVIDVSKWQSSLPDLSGVSGVIARAGIGTKPDIMFTTHIAKARAAGKWVGSYWYNWGDLSVSDQVNAYIAREKEVGGVDLHTIDWEGTEGFTAAQTADFIRIYRARTGNPILLYASESRFRDLGQDANWIANYSNEPSKAYDMWQYGPFRGVDGNHARQRILDLVGKGDSMSAIAAASGLRSNYLIDLPLGAKVYEDINLTDLMRTYEFKTTVPYIGLPIGETVSGGSRAVLIRTASPYTDGIVRETVGYIKTALATPYLAPVVTEPADDSPFTQDQLTAAVTAAVEAKALELQAAITAAEQLAEARLASLTAAESIIENQKAALLATAEFKAAHAKLLNS